MSYTVRQFIELVDELKETSKKADKIERIKEVMADNPEIVDTFAFIVDPKINVGVSEHTFDNMIGEPNAGDSETSLAEIISDVREMIEAGVSTDDQVDVFLSRFSFDEYNQALGRLIVARTTRCGVSVGTVNTIAPGSIFVPPYMRCTSQSKGDYSKWISAIVQEKMDGMFVNIIQTGPHINDISVFTRSWTDITEKVIDSSVDLSDDVNLNLTNQYAEGVVFHGELLVWDDGGETYMSREDGNGYINGDEVDKSRIRFIIWDIIPYNDFMQGKSDVPYEYRIGNIRPFINSALPNMRPINSQWVEPNEEAIKEVYAEFRRGGSEGVVLKNPMGGWKDGTSKDSIKMKVEVDCDVRVIGWKKGVGKYADSIGSITIQSDDGEILCEVGSGLTDAQRKDIDFIEKFIADGGIACVRYNDVVENKLIENKKSLYLPRLIEFRTDKTEADTTAKIEEQLNG